jgi:PTS system nitrogen regulatory IIA component
MENGQPVFLSEIRPTRRIMPTVRILGRHGAIGRMKILDIVSSESVIAELRSRTKQDVLRELAERVERTMPSMKAEILTSVLLDRETLGSTGIGEGIAIPHGKAPQINRLVAAFGRSIQGVPFDSMDDKPVHLVFLIVAPPDLAGMHLKALARISRLLKDAAFRQRLMGAAGAEELEKIFRDEDNRG